MDDSRKRLNLLEEADKAIDEEIKAYAEQSVLSNRAPDSRLKYGEYFDEKISLQALPQRWNANKKLIDELCFAKKLRPYRGSCEGAIYTLDGDEVIVFLKVLPSNEQCIIEDLSDCQKFESLPDDTFFYLQDILSFEDTHPEVKKTQSITEAAGNKQATNAPKPITPLTSSQTKVVVDDGNRPLRNKAEQSASNETGVNSVFARFNNLRSNEVSLVMLANQTTKIVIRKKTIQVSPAQLGLKPTSQGWRLLEGAAISGGDLSSALSRLNSSSDYEKEQKKTKTAVSRLRDKLVKSMGLSDDPIPYQPNGGWKFAFIAMTHELLNGDRATKGADAMDYIDDRGFDDTRQNEGGFWVDDDGTY